MDRGILERDREVGQLTVAAREAAAGAGSVALVFGEAGIGKSSLVRALPPALPADARTLVGQCDDLTTRRPLGPFTDLVGAVGPHLTKALADGGDRQRVYDALRTELSAPPHPAVLVVEDVHWADEATLDALRYLVRRMPQLPALLVLTYRDDELGREHPLRHLLGQIPRADRLHRLPLPRLSEAAVRTLGAGSRLDPAEVYAVTSGNPFFVTEVLADGQAGGVPPTVVDAVLARLSGLAPATVDALEQLAVVPTALERWLVDALVPGGIQTLAAAEQRGLLVVAPDRAGFRHELIRRALADSLPAARRIALNRVVLTALLEYPKSASCEGGGSCDLSRIVHHAAEAGDLDAISRYGPTAAAAASRAGAHREAAAHLALVLRQRGRYEPPELATLLEQYAIECYTLGDSEQAVAAQHEAVALRRELGDHRKLGADLRWLSRIHWWAGDVPLADRAAAEAIAVLEREGDPELLALALSNQAQLHMLGDRHATAIEIGERAVALARELGDAGLLSHALNNVGCARWRSGDAAAGRPVLEESLAVALASGEVEHACRAYVNIVWSLLENLRYADADHFLTAAMDLADQAEHLGFLGYMYAELAMRELAAARWDAAARAAELAVGLHVPARCPALTVLGRIRVRTGRPGGEELLAQAWELAVRTGELQRTGPVAAGLAEAAALRDDHEAVVAAARPVYEQARRLGVAHLRAELGYWLRVAEAPTGSPRAPVATAGQPVGGSAGGRPHPYDLQAAGRWREAAAAWQDAGCPYERAAALAESPLPEDRFAALAQLDALGARPLARVVRAGLKAEGVRHIPRGPAPATRRNAAGLTGRQLEVTRLLARGLTNAEIAARLVLSVRTVDHHVAAVLEKLGAPTRRDVLARAADLGLLPARRLD
ncbi:ATP-binding protein [Streptomyces boninensis]|uniref:ATP-binding protein n=1 Tax=Streptomyces boninensis TaxID=2039455 RepID=UPI003B20E7BC